MAGRHRKKTKPRQTSVWPVLTGVAIVCGVWGIVDTTPGKQLVPPELVAAPAQPNDWRAAKPKAVGPHMVKAAQTIAPRRVPPITGAQGLVPNAQKLAAYIQQKYPDVKSIGGVRPCDIYMEHCRGIALDIMVGSNTKLGNEINADLLANAQKFGIRFTMWQHRQQKPTGAVYWVGERGTPTANHLDHLHVSVA